MPEPYSSRLPCVGGPFDGEPLYDWLRPTDTYLVFQRAGPKGRSAAGVRDLTVALWASDLPYTRPPAGVHLGHYRLDHWAGQATWVPA